MQNDVKVEGEADTKGWSDMTFVNTSEAHHIIPESILGTNTRLAVLIEWDKGKIFNFIGGDNGLMMLPVHNGIGHHSNSPTYAGQIDNKINAIMAKYDLKKEDDKGKALEAIKKFVENVKKEIVDDCIEKNRSLNTLSIKSQ
ncbi:AHH domain-containing protein [Runella sp. MFBS21]|uniref:AHH domain-containing protein n=1 Tax=Runella sp. MFBS21 TaxID=3034018 RepID=UPI0023F6D979|nr:AHH domain-containing protein [Runella sp. MFBS21]MDF7819528.1 AHH domain-containing protein [Runella sp. MFBS21]